jgi:hypothetical protein
MTCADCSRRKLSQPPGRGFGPAFAVQIGLLADNFVCAVLGRLGAAALFTLPSVAMPLTLVGPKPPPSSGSPAIVG